MSADTARLSYCVPALTVMKFCAVKNQLGARNKNYLLTVYIMRRLRSAEVDGYKKLKFKVGLALSGGGTKGLADIGVFRAFEEEHIRFDCVAGTSAGSIFGSLYAAGVSWQTMLEEAKKVRKRDIINSMFVLGSDSLNVGRVVRNVIGDIDIEDLKLPFAAVAVDIVNGIEVVLDSGSVATAVSASSTVPAIFKPVRYGDYTLVDGGLLNNMPADVCRLMGAEVVIGVDLNHERGKGNESTKLLATLQSTWNIITVGTMYKGYHNSDVVIKPELGAYKNTELDHLDEMVEEGYLAAMRAMPEIKETLLLK